MFVCVGALFGVFVLSVAESGGSCLFDCPLDCNVAGSDAASVTLWCANLTTRSTPAHSSCCRSCVVALPSSSLLLLVVRGGQSNRTVFLSINRFERKKAIHLALQAVGVMRGLLTPAQFKNVQLVIAGGYDPRVRENVEYYEELVDMEKVRSGGRGAARRCLLRRSLTGTQAV